MRAAHPSTYAFCDKYLVECKHWKSLNLPLFLSGKGDLWEALVRTRDDATKQGKCWMLIAKQNHIPVYLLMPGTTQWDYNLNGQLVYHKLFKGTIFLFDLETFLKEVPPECLK